MKFKTLASAAILFAASSTTLAQTPGGTGAGLDKLDELQVMTTMTNSNLNTLVDRDFAKFNIAPAQQAQVMTLTLLKTLNDPSLTVAGRRALTAKVAHGLDALLPSATDPDQLFKQANELFTYGITPIVEQLDYFGENPAAQADLKPAAETAKKMYARVADLAEAKVNLLANKVNQANINQMMPQLQAVRQTKELGKYCDNMATYALCVSLPKTDPARKSNAAASILYLTQYDNPKSNIQPIVHLQIGKMQLAAGDFAAAKTTFDSFEKPGDFIPPPDLTQQNTAKYFGIVAEMSDRKLNDAAADIPKLEAWELANYLPKLPNPADQASVHAAMAMIKFRLYTSQSDLNNDQDQKKKQNDQAIEVLAKLVADQPQLKDLVFDQLIGRIPADQDLTTLNPFILQALEEKGVVEVLKKPEEKADEKILKRAIDAARELINRKGQPGVTDAVAARAAQFIAYGYDRLGQNVEAATAFMDLAEKFADDKAKSEDAMDHAEATIGAMRKKDPADEAARKLYDRYLPLAINPPFNRKKFALQYAKVLQGEQKYKEAVEYFQQVPQNDKLYPQSQFLQMLALNSQAADKTLSDDDKKALVNRVLDLTRTIEGFYSTATTESDKATYVEWVADADEIAADLSRRILKDPAKTLAILDGFETKIAASKDAASSHNEAMKMRIEAYMDQGNIDQATKVLLNLMSADQDLGQKLMFGVLQTVDRDMEDAQAAKKTDDLKRLAQDRAELSGFVVSWAQKSKDPKVTSGLVGFQLYDADSKRVAAELVDDPAVRKTRLQEAFNEYQEIIKAAPDNLTAQLGLGLTAFPMENYQLCVDMLAPLMDNSKVLKPTEEVTVGGNTTVRENPQFWDANYKRLQSLVELYKKSPTDPKSQENLKSADGYLKTLYVIYGTKTGGVVHHDEYETLKAELAGLLKK